MYVLDRATRGLHIWFSYMDKYYITNTGLNCQTCFIYVPCYFIMPPNDDLSKKKKKKKEHAKC